MCLGVREPAPVVAENEERDQTAAIVSNGELIAIKLRRRGPKRRGGAKSAAVHL